MEHIIIFLDNILFPIILEKQHILPFINIFFYITIPFLAFSLVQSSKLINKKVDINNPVQIHRFALLFKTADIYHRAVLPIALYVGISFTLCLLAMAFYYISIDQFLLANHYIEGAYLSIPLLIVLYLASKKVSGYAPFTLSNGFMVTSSSMCNPLMGRLALHIPVSKSLLLSDLSEIELTCNRLAEVSRQPVDISSPLFNTGKNSNQSRTIVRRLNKRFSTGNIVVTGKRYIGRTTSFFIKRATRHKDIINRLYDTSGNAYMNNVLWVPNEK